MRPTGTSNELQQRRMRAVALLDEGYRPGQVARMVGVTPGAISQWKKRYERAGPEALKAKPHPGPTPRLTPKQCKQLVRLLLKGPAWHGYTTDLWTLNRVAEVIRKRFGVRYDLSAVWRVLQRMDWSCQKPERRARERDDEAIARWRRQDWPRIKKRKAKRS
jgi:transposase